MANRFPLIVNTTSGNSVQELPSGDFLDLSSSGIANSGNITVTASSFFIGNGSQLTGITSSYGNANVVANLAALGSNPVSTTANVTGGNILTGGLISATSTVTGSSLLGSVASLSGNVTGGNILTGGLISATGNITGGNITTGGAMNITGASQAASYSATGNVTGGNILTGGLISATGNITGGNLSGTSIAGTLTTASQTNITSVGTLGSLTVTANVSGGNILTGGLISATGAITGAGITGTSLTVSTGTVTLGNIVNANGNAVGNIGSSSNYFNTIFGKATTAQYADLAENYLGDAAYVPGTVLDFDGEQEVTLSTRDSSKRVAGVVSTNPAHLMNSTLDGAHVTAVALAGRVPTQVTGKIAKGDLMVSAGNGRARAEANPATGTVIGKALENFDGGEGTIEIVISMQ